LQWKMLPGVQLAEPEMLLEIEAVAMIPEKR
jgi:hypothetical protein